MAQPVGELDLAERHVLSSSRVWVRNAGGARSRFVLVADFFPRHGQKKRLQSNDLKYGKSWATAEEITRADKLAFLDWIDNKRSNKGVGGNARARASSEGATATRTSARIGIAFRDVCTRDKDVIRVEEAVMQCVNFLVHTVVRQSRSISHRQTPPRLHRVASKRRCRKTDSAALLSARSLPILMTKRMKAAKLTQRKRESKGYQYRLGVLKRAAACRAEQDMGWLHHHRHRLATVVARQCLQELLPDGAATLSSTQHVPLRNLMLCSAVERQATTRKRNFYVSIARRWP